MIRDSAVLLQCVSSHSCCIDRLSQQTVIHVWGMFGRYPLRACRLRLLLSFAAIWRFMFLIKSVMTQWSAALGMVLVHNEHLSISQNLYTRTVHIQTFYIHLQFDHMCITDMSINFCKYLHHAIKNKPLLPKSSNTILSTLRKLLISLLLGNLVKHYTGCILRTNRFPWVFSSHIKINHFA